MNRKLSILIIDDDPNMRYLTSRTLKTHISDYDLIIHEADNGAVGLDYLTASTSLPDFILLDINMPVMDGLTFLNEYSFPTPIYILSTMVTYWKQEPVMIPQFVKGSQLSASVFHSFLPQIGTSGKHSRQTGRVGFAFLF